MNSATPTLEAAIPRKTGKSRQTILLVDDFGTFCSLVWCQLMALDYHVLIASGESGARELLAQHWPEQLDLLILDLNLPLPKCREIAQSFRKINPGTKVLLMSSQPNLAKPDQNIGYLQKPFPIESLGEHLREFMGEDTGGGEAEVE